MVSRENIVDRVFWCQNLYIAHFFLHVVFLNTALFSHTFRTVLIRFADRGLVLQGKPNLKLFSQLFWLILIPYCCIGMMMAPLFSILSGRFTQVFVAKICTLSPSFDQDPKKIMTQHIVPLMVPLLNLGYGQYLNYKVRQYFRPNQKMYSFGNYRRNFITFEENRKYIIMNFWYSLLTNLVLNILFLNGETFSLTPEKMSWVQNLWNFLYLDIFHGLILPTKMTIHRKWQRNVSKTFWQRKNMPEPRRGEQMFQNPVSKSTVTLVSPFIQEQITPIERPERENETTFSQGEVVAVKSGVKTSDKSRANTSSQSRVNTSNQSMDTTSNQFRVNTSNQSMDNTSNPTRVNTSNQSRDNTSKQPSFNTKDNTGSQSQVNTTNRTSLHFVKVEID